MGVGNLTMIYYGTLLESYVSTPNEWSRYLRVVFCVEIGYGLEIIRTNVFGKDQIEKVEKISLGSQVQFTGFFADTPNVRFFKLQSVDAAKFDSCETCFAPKEDPCTGCLKEPTERISGEWQLVERLMVNDSFKLIFTQDENVVCRYIFPQSPFYKECISLKVTDMVKLQGWRDERRRTELNIMEKSTK